MKQKKQLYFLIIFSILAVPFIGLLTLSQNTSNSITTFICLVGIGLAGFFFKKKFNDRSKIVPIGGAGMILYIIAHFVLIGRHSIQLFLLSTPLIAFSCYALGVILASIDRKYLPIYSVSLIAVITIYATFLYPLSHTISSRAIKEKNSELFTMAISDLALSDCKEAIVEGNLDNRVIVIENWNEYCGKCISAMQDLHPWLNEMEENYKGQFAHLYMYNKPNINSKFSHSEEACQFNLLPYEDMNIVISDNDLPSLQTAPKFLFVDKNGNIVDVMVGYNGKYTRAYKRKIEKKLAQLLTE
ncbi:MAG: hypothetical protein AAGG68_07120 [Bacteroidota bacterium]